jgi:hypothetical protein
MRKFLPFILLFLICWTLAFVCLRSSISAKNGYEHCVESDAITSSLIPERSNCAKYPDLSLLSSSVLEMCAIGLFILPFGVSLILKWKNDRSEQNYIESIKIVI